MDGLDGKTLAVLSYALVMGLVGVPMWWQTTDVIRFPLPFDRIDVINQTAVKQSVNIVFVSSDNQLPLGQCGTDSSIYKLMVESRQPTKEESVVIADKSATLSEIDQRLHLINEKIADQLLVFDLSHLQQQQQDKLVIGEHRSVFFSSAAAACQVLNRVRERVLGESVINQMTQSIVAPEQGQVRKSKWSQIKATPSPDYDILLTLLIPEPQLRKVRWNMRKAVADYLQPFLDQLSDIYSFSVKSQVLYLTSLGLSATQQMTDAKSGKIGNGIRQRDLGLAINMDSKLVSHVSSKPSFNFLAYVPTEAQSPLYIKAAEEGTFLETNAFVVPRWGGVSIWNLDEDKPGNATTKQQQHSIDERRFMSIVATQLRLLLGLKDHDNNNDDVTSDTSDVIALPAQRGLREWEKDFLLRMKIFENLMTSNVTLTSLAHLLSKISNIVITQEVADEVEIAVEAYESCLECLTRATNVQPCFKHSRTAFMSSERVFFDNSLLELLYFPEDQKYAIYVPLFLPILFGFFVAFVPVLKQLKNALIQLFKKQIL